MSNSREISPVECLKFWFEQNLNFYEMMCTSYKYSAPRRGSAEISLETEKYIIGICAWDIANSLEIKINDLESDAIKFPVNGPHNSIEEFKTSLDNHLSWMRMA